MCIRITFRYGSENNSPNRRFWVPVNESDFCESIENGLRMNAARWAMNADGRNGQ